MSVHVDMHHQNKIPERAQDHSTFKPVSTPGMQTFYKLKYLFNDTQVHTADDTECSLSAVNRKNNG